VHRIKTKRAPLETTKNERERWPARAMSVKHEHCVTCLVEMCYPGCGGLVLHAFKQDTCGVCFHPVGDHAPEKLAELKASYAKESRLDFHMFDEAEEAVRNLLGTLSELNLEDAPADGAPDSHSGTCPVCSGVTFSFAGDFALPCEQCPKPPTPPSRRNRSVTGAAATRPSKAEAEPQPLSASAGSLSTSKGRALVNKLVSPRSGSVTSPVVSPKATAKEAFNRKPVQAVAPKEVPQMPDKPLLVPQKGFACEWGSSNPVDSKCHIVDDDRYAPFYAHYFAKGKRKHAIFVGSMPESDDPVLLALERPETEGDDVEDAAMAVRGLLFTCKPLSIESDDRWVFLDPTVPMDKDLPEKKPALAGVKWREVVDEDFSDQLLNYEQKILSNTDRFKFGLLYIKENQTKDENAMFQNPTASEEMVHFMKSLGDVVQLKGWDKYAGGLNVKDGTTGDESLYTTMRGYQIMFHVSTFLPHRQGDDQCLDKKRHLGNDVVVVVFCDSENVKFDPLEMHSQFNHVFVVVVPAGVSPTSGKRQYRIAISRKPGVPPIEPKLKYPGIYEEGDNFREVLLTKLINGERMAMVRLSCIFSFFSDTRFQYAPDFVRKMYRTRKELMNLLIRDVKVKKQSVFKQVLETSKSQINKLQARSSVTLKEEGGSSGDERRSSAGEVSKSKSLSKIMRKRTIETPSSVASAQSSGDRKSGSQVVKK
jgi:hypothetical protein